MVVLGLGILSMLHTMCGCTLAVRLRGSKHDSGQTVPAWVAQNQVLARRKGDRLPDWDPHTLRGKLSWKTAALGIWIDCSRRADCAAEVRAPFCCLWQGEMVGTEINWFLLPKINKQEEIMEVTSFWLSVCKWDLSQTVGFCPQKILELWWTHLCSWLRFERSSCQPRAL